ncbi:hypothetical protein ACFL13_00080 [Patescibacteria group bacterium]
MKFKLSKKQIFGLQGALLALTGYLTSLYLPESYILGCFLFLVLSVSASIIIHLENVSFKNIVPLTTLPFSMLLGMYFFLQFFPNFTLVFKWAGIVASAVAFYIIALTNNIFLVVEDRGETIPLYRVAQTWSKIILITVAIPLLSGIFKLPLNTFIQGLFAGIISVFFIMYVFWNSKHDSDVKNCGVGELTTLLGFSFFTIYSTNLAVSFIPTESFLRALFISSVLMFSIAVVDGHIKNKLNKKLVTENILIVLFFLLLLVFFKA